MQQHNRSGRGQRWRWDGSRCFIPGRTPHLHQKEFGKPGALEEEEEALPLEKGDLSHASVPAYSISFLEKKRGGEEKKKLLPVQELAHHLADKATRLLPPVHQERSRTGPQMTAKRPHSLQTGFYCSRTSSVCKDLRSSTGTGTIARHIQFWFWKIPR